MKVEQYPMGDADTCPRRTVLVGQKKGGKLKAELVRLSQVAERKRISLRSEITPPLMSSEERAQGETTNAKMHRLING